MARQDKGRRALFTGRPLLSPENVPRIRSDHSAHFQILLTMLLRRVVVVVVFLVKDSTILKL